MPAAQVRAIDGVVQTALADQQVPGASVAVVRGGRVVFARGYGLRDASRALPADATTRYGVGSLTKTLVAALTLQLAEERRLSLDDSVATWLPAFSGDRAVTVRDLLSLRAGIRDYNDAAFVAGLPAAFLPGRADRPAILRKLATLPTKFPPGSAFDYSNADFLVLGAILERAGGAPLPALLHDRIFAPLGMADTQLGDAPGGDDATGYTKGPLGPVAVAQWDPQLTYAAGGIRSSALDIARFDAALCAHRIVSAPAFGAMTLAGKPIGAESRYGLGLFAHDDPDGRRVAWHDGTVLGFKAMNVLVPQSCDAVVVLANADYAHAPALGLQVERATFGGPPLVPEPLDLALPRWSDAIGAALALALLAASLLLRRRITFAVVAAALAYAAAATWLPAGIVAFGAGVAVVAWPSRRV